MNLREVPSFGLFTIPYSLAHSDGTLKKPTKSVLLAALERIVNVKPRLPTNNNAPTTAHFIEEMAQVQMGVHLLLETLSLHVKCNLAATE